MAKLSDLKKVKAKRVMGIDCSTYSLAFCVFYNRRPEKWGKINFEGRDVFERMADAAQKVHAMADPHRAVAEVKGEGLITSTGRMYRQDYVVFLRAADGKIAFLREYFDPVRAATALGTAIPGLES